MAATKQEPPSEFSAAVFSFVGRRADFSRLRALQGGKHAAIVRPIQHTTRETKAAWLIALL
jgi:hypothetical protein